MLPCSEYLRPIVQESHIDAHDETLRHPYKRDDRRQVECALDGVSAVLHSLMGLGLSGTLRKGSAWNFGVSSRHLIYVLGLDESEGEASLFLGSLFPEVLMIRVLVLGGILN